MSHLNNRWPNLIDKYLKGQLTDSEMEELKRQKAATPWKQEQFERFATRKGILEQLKKLDEMDIDRDWKTFKMKYIHHPQTVNTNLKVMVTGTIAAVVLGSILILGIYLFIRWWQRPVTRHLPSLTITDIAHGNEALFILSDGTTIKLDSIPDGEQIASNIPFIKKNSHIYPSIVQNLAHNIPKGVNTLYVPAGRQYQLTLPDSTKIKVNTNTSIYFPSVFPDDYRWVAINGEAFFDVTKKTKKPFFINIKNKMCAEVFGTSFNITGYDDNGFIKTTVIEGIIKIAILDTKNQIINSKNLFTRQQAHWVNGSYSIIDGVNLKQVTAWTKGEFNFDKRTTREIMQEISRWYNVKIRYEGKIPAITFTGSLPRSMPLPEMIDAIKRTNQIHITATPDNVLTIMPKRQATDMSE